MKKYYIIDYNDEDYNAILNDLELFKPDIIIFAMFSEYCFAENAKYGFFPRYELLKEYLLSNNILLYVISPFVGNKSDNYTYENVHHDVGRVTMTRAHADGLIHTQYNNTRVFQFKDNIKLYTNYNHNCKWERSMLVDYLAKYDLLKDGIVTLHHPDTNEYTFQYYDGSVLLDEPDFEFFTFDVGSKYPKSYYDGFIDIVSETSYGEGQIFITEKTLKPILALKPFLIYGPPGIHRHMADIYGFKLYTELFDYSFDDIDDIEYRLEGLLSNIIKYKNISIDQMKDMREVIINKLIHNFTILETNRWNRRTVHGVIDHLADHGPYEILLSPVAALHGKEWYLCQ